jgi:hypothetical protein
MTTRWATPTALERAEIDHNGLSVEVVTPFTHPAMKKAT